MLRIADQVIAPFEINVDESQYTLLKMVTITNDKKSSRVGEKRESNLGYYTSFEGLIEKVVRLKIEEDNKNAVITLKEYLTQYQNITNTLKELIRG